MGDEPETVLSLCLSSGAESLSLFDNRLCSSPPVCHRPPQSAIWKCYRLFNMYSENIMAHVGSIKREM